MAFFSAWICLSAEEFAVYNTLCDVGNPTIEELQRIQQAIHEPERPELEYFVDIVI
ncbi:MAG TPA: hypothetical protein VGJ00_00685 [Rhabdochlamydiaceae bacterium]